MAADVGLGNQVLLTKIDKLRELNVGAIIPLPQVRTLAYTTVSDLTAPQLVVVGDQSSGKSSVLESLTGFSFPRAAGLCTRYATQITCSRASEESVTITIIPHPQADEALKTKLQDFHQHITTIHPENLAAIFQSANDAMGIRTSAKKETLGLRTFSEDILKIEICGPTQEHFTVIDVPGIFRVATPGEALILHLKHEAFN